jgi:very-short-patch-repair endonuclease
MRSFQADKLAQYASQMRASPTTTESLLWEALRGKRQGAAFRRQVVVGSYIVDVLAPSRKLVVEVDGGYHAGRQRADARRDRKLARLGYRVLRIPADLVLHQLPEAVRLVRAALTA